MALFFFHLIDGGSVVRDTIGFELLDLYRAKNAAQMALSRHALDATSAGMPYPDHTAIEICDTDGRVLDIEWCWCLVRDPTRLNAR